MNDIAAKLGQIGLPAPISELAAKEWDDVVVGGGHNGLACAAYLARGGRRVLVLERRERLGGACTLEQPFSDPGFVMSPCAYVLGLLDQRVIDELDLYERGLKVFVADPNLWAPFQDGTSFGQWLDDAKTLESLRALGLSQRDIDGYFAYEGVFDVLRRKLRTGARDAWEGSSPSRAELEEMLDQDKWLIDILFNASIAEVLDHYLTDERMKNALYGQGVIGAYAGPYDWGTASVKLMHYQGDTEGQGPVWAYVEGGMGQVSFAIASAARDAGAVLCAGTPVTEILPGEGVRLEGGDLIRSVNVISNADPKRAVGLIPSDRVPTAVRQRIDGWQVRSPVVKFNAALGALPTFTAVEGERYPYFSMISVTPGMGAAQSAFEDCKRAVANIGYGEIYFQTGYDPSSAPPGKHLMSVFGQYAPYTLGAAGPDGDPQISAQRAWDSQRDAIAKQVIELIRGFAPDITDCIEEYEVLGPPDIEARIGLTGGHIFQGETMPDQMWEHRLAPDIGIEGFWLCGAATHPAGSVIGLNGRNAAAAVLGRPVT